MRLSVHAKLQNASRHGFLKKNSQRSPENRLVESEHPLKKRTRLRRATSPFISRNLSPCVARFFVRPLLFFIFEPLVRGATREMKAGR